jgi:hypothetical protein
MTPSASRFSAAATAPVRHSVTGSRSAPQDARRIARGKAKMMRRTPASYVARISAETVSPGARPASRSRSSPRTSHHAFERPTTVLSKSARDPGDLVEVSAVVVPPQKENRSERDGADSRGRRRRRAETCGFSSLEQRLEKMRKSRPSGPTMRREPTDRCQPWKRHASPLVRTVVGQILPHLMASIRVLEKAGFRYVGAGNDPYAPAEERVIRYELSRDDFSRGVP